jgi:TatD DNase family protein
MFVDSHCHLNDPQLKGELSSILERAKSLEVGCMLTISTDLKEVSELEKISEDHPEIYHTVGVHPHEVDKEGVPLLNNLLEKLQHPKAVGIGETGLDYYYEHSNREQQKRSFQFHIQAMKETGLPLVIHSRNAEEDILTLLQQEGVKNYPRPGVIHCFSGTKEFAKATLDLGFYISLSGILTFKNAEDLREIAKTLPLDRLLIETDSPYLAPIPHRGKRNEPSFVIHTAEKLAEIKGVSLKTIRDSTTNNFFTLFSKTKRDIINS